MIIDDEFFLKFFYQIIKISKIAVQKNYFLFNL